MTNTNREINIKPSCMTEIMALPRDQYAMILDKINILVDNPLPDGRMKKKLKGYEGIFRLRVGDFRIFYNFSDKWVKLLGIRRRDESTYRGNIEPEQPVTQESEDNIDIENISQQRTYQPGQFKLKKEEDTSYPLPFELTAEWLESINIPLGYIPRLITCKTENALLSVNIPSEFIDRVIEQIIETPLDEVEKQPDLIVSSTDDLIKYKEGSLLSFLLKLDNEQKSIADWSLKGPTMVKGGAGTGKSTIALYRVKSLLEQPGNTGNETLLFTTYTQALIRASRQLLKQILNPGQLERVRIATCDEIAREIVVKFENIREMENSNISLQTLKKLRQNFVPPSNSAFEKAARKRALDTLSDRYIIEEFDWIIDGRGLKTLEQYLEAPRPGRGFAFQKGLRETIWELHQRFETELSKNGYHRWSELRIKALEYIKNKKWKNLFDYVVVDEAQDLSPNALIMMAELVKTENGLFFAADNKQSLYSRNYSWTSVHPRLQFTGKTKTLKRNYRSTQEIDRAAFDILKSEEYGDLEKSISLNSGPFPVLVDEVPAEEESLWTERFIRQMAKHLRVQVSASAVLVPTKQIGEAISNGLNQRGLPAKFFSGKELDLQSDKVKVITLHSAKGLEFPIVVVCGFLPGTYPVKLDFEDQNVFQERINNEQKLLYVGLSRAMRGLMLIRPKDCKHETLNDINLEYWHVETK